VLNLNNLDNLSNALSFGNQTYRNKKNNYSDFDIILYYNNNNQSYISSDNQQEILFIKSVVTAFILGIVIISTIVGKSKLNLTRHFEKL
jgi:uncharacterized protein YlbG (UPF0298 family)